jgi:hypothetical protein
MLMDSPLLMTNTPSYLIATPTLQSTFSQQQSAKHAKSISIQCVYELQQQQQQLQQLIPTQSGMTMILPTPSQRMMVGRSKSDPSQLVLHWPPA